MTLGLGRGAVVKVPTNDRYEMEVDDARASHRRDRAAGLRPIADRRDRRHDVVDLRRPGRRHRGHRRARGPLAPRRRGLRRRGRDRCPSGARRSRGWERADSIVVNPHKWLFTPLDASLLLTRRMEPLRAAFSLVPEYLRTLDREAPVRDYNEYTPQLGRRMRALKLWMQLRWFGLEGLRRRIERHLELAAAFAALDRRRPGLGAARARAVLDGLLPLPAAGARRARGRARGPPGSTRPTPRLMDAVNRTGEVFLSHTRLRDRFTIRLAIGNLRTEARHVERAWELLARPATLTPEEAAA